MIGKGIGDNLEVERKVVDDHEKEEGSENDAKEENKKEDLVENKEKEEEKK